MNTMLRSYASAARKIFVLAAIVLPTTVGAQGLQDASAILAPHFTQYNIGSGAGKRTISQTSVPLVVVLPFSERFSVDVTTAFASSQVKGAGNTSDVNGLTDTQVRGNYTFGDDFVVVTLGLNLPTGQYSIAEEQIEAAGQIGNDFLNYPISSMGNGLAGTGGIALARSAGSWNLGVGASFRKSTEFAAFTQSSDELRFTPADEYRFRLSGDRPVGDGQLTLGLAYSAFGEDLSDNTTYGTGDRITASGTWMFPVSGTDIYLSAWNLYRLEGERIGVGGDPEAAPKENVANVNLAASFEAGPTLIQPSVEARFWQIDGARAGQITNLGVRVRLIGGNFEFFPSAGYTIGKLYSVATGAATDVTGVRLSMTIVGRR